MRTALKFMAIGLTVLAAPLMSAPAFADEPQIYTSWRNNIAVGGYDAVSFFKGKPQEGKTEFSATHKGAAGIVRGRLPMGNWQKAVRSTGMWRMGGSI